MAESKVNIALALGVERWLTVLFVDEPSGWNGAKPTGCVDYRDMQRRGGCEEGADGSA